MVVYVGMNKTGCKSECTEDLSIKSSKITNSTYNFGGKTEMDSTQYLVQNSRRAYRIKSGKTYLFINFIIVKIRDIKIIGFSIM